MFEKNIRKEDVKPGDNQLYDVHLKRQLCRTKLKRKRRTGIRNKDMWLLDFTLNI